MCKKKKHATIFRDIRERERYFIFLLRRHIVQLDCVVLHRKVQTRHHIAVSVKEKRRAFVFSFCCLLLLLLEQGAPDINSHITGVCFSLYQTCSTRRFSCGGTGIESRLLRTVVGFRVFRGVFPEAENGAEKKERAVQMPFACRVQLFALTQDR